MIAESEYKPLPFDEAIQLFKDKVVVTPYLYRRLADEVKMRAFTVSGIMEADILLDIYEELLKGIEQGLTFETFKKNLFSRYDQLGWMGETPYRLETAFRTNIQTMYQAGHYAQQMEVVQALPFWQYVAVMDSRTRPAHAMMHGVVYPYDHPFWKNNYPPNGFNCRCTVRALSGHDLLREGLTVAKTHEDIADKGWDHNPGEAAYRPDLSKYPDWLREAMQ